jgi:hypothetical protein
MFWMLVRGDIYRVRLNRLNIFLEADMEKNVGTVDRAIRFAIVLLTSFAFLKGWLKGKLGLVIVLGGASLISSVASGYCPLYDQLGITTAPEQKASH